MPWDDRPRRWSTRTGYSSYKGDSKTTLESVIRCILIFLSIFLVVLFFPWSMVCCVQIVNEYERLVVFRLGRLRKDMSKKPGLKFVMPCVDTFWRLDLRTITFDVPYQEVLTKDSVNIYVDAVIYYRVENAIMAVANVQEWEKCTRLLGATALRNVLGMYSLATILSERNPISVQVRRVLDEATNPWGISVERVEMKEVRLPKQLQRAMAAEAEAMREAKARVIAAQGEQRAARSMRDAAQIIAESSTALQLRFLQTLQTIAAEKNHSIVVPIPMDFIMRLFGKNAKK